MWRASHRARSVVEDLKGPKHELRRDRHERVTPKSLYDQLVGERVLRVPVQLLVSRRLELLLPLAPLSPDALLPLPCLLQVADELERQLGRHAARHFLCGVPTELCRHAVTFQLERWRAEVGLASGRAPHVEAHVNLLRSSPGARTDDGDADAWELSGASLQQRTAASSRLIRLKLAGGAVLCAARQLEVVGGCRYGPARPGGGGRGG